MTVSTTLHTSSATTPSSLDVLQNYSSFPDMVTYCLLVVFTLTFLLNTVVAAALYRARRLKPVLRVLLFNLALTDTLAGLVNVYHMVVANLILSFSFECLIRYGLVVELISVSLAFILLLSLDRVVSLVAALQYEQIVTEKRLWVISALSWLTMLVFPVVGLWDVDMSLPFCIFQVMIPTSTFFMYGICTLIFTTIILALNIFTFRKALGHISKIASSVVGEGRQERITAMNHKAAVTSLAIVVPYLVLTTPLNILFLVFAVKPYLTESLNGLIAISVCLGLITTKSLLNPFIYTWRSTEVRAEVKRVMGLGTCCKKDDQSTITTSNDQ